MVFSAFDAIAGIATGVLTRHASSLTGHDQQGVVAAGLRHLDAKGDATGGARARERLAALGIASADSTVGSSASGAFRRAQLPGEELRSVRDTTRTER